MQLPFSVSYQLTEEDYVQSVMKRFMKRQMLRYAIYFLFFIFWFYYINNAGLNAAAVSAWLPFVLLSAMPVVMYFLTRRGVRKNYRNNAALHGTQEYEFGEDYITSRSLSSEAKIGWENVKKTELSGNYLLLFINSFTNAYFIPTNQLSEEQQQWIKKRIGRKG